MDPFLVFPPPPSQLYTAFVESQEQLQLERLENKRVNSYLDDILQEVEAKAPVLKRQRDEHERMQQSVASLSAKLGQAVKVTSAERFRTGSLCVFVTGTTNILI